MPVIDLTITGESPTEFDCVTIARRLNEREGSAYTEALGQIHAWCIANTWSSVYYSILQAVHDLRYLPYPKEERAAILALTAENRRMEGMLRRYSIDCGELRGMLYRSQKESYDWSRTVDKLSLSIEAADISVPAITLEMKL